MKDGAGESMHAQGEHASYNEYTVNTMSDTKEEFAVEMAPVWEKEEISLGWLQKLENTLSTVCGRN